MDIDSEHLGIPDTTYDAVVTMSSVRFAEIVRDLQVMNDSGKYFFYISHHHHSNLWSIVTIECTKEGIKFGNEGEIAKGCVTLKANSMIDNVSGMGHFC